MTDNIDHKDTTAKPVHPGSENLKPWVKGQSGNPEGKKKGTKNVKTQLKKWLSLDSLQKSPDGEDETLDYYDAILINRIKYAVAGDKDAVNFIFDRLEGKPVQGIEMSKSKADELEDMSKEQLQEEAEKLMKEINERSRGESPEIEESEKTTPED